MVSRLVPWVASAIAACVGSTLGLHAQAPRAVDDRPTADFRSGATLVRTDVIVRDANGAFVPDLGPDDFIVEEDGVRQQVASLVLVNGGRVFNQLIPPARFRRGSSSRRRRRLRRWPGGSSSCSSTSSTCRPARSGRSC